MPTLYRVFPWTPEARDGEPGHPLFVPGSGVGRVDNPEHYRTLYLSDSGAGACAEAFAYLPVWRQGMLRGAPAVPGSFRALATFELDGDAGVCDLDDAARLLALGLRPSAVVTRERGVTQAWALRVFREGRWAGVRWWSFHDPRWGSHGIWAIDALVLEHVEPLSLDHPDLEAAAEVLSRPLG
jgi:hypothetical protein